MSPCCNHRIWSWKRTGETKTNMHTRLWMLELHFIISNGLKIRNFRDALMAVVSSFENTPYTMGREGTVFFLLEYLNYLEQLNAEVRHWQMCITIDFFVIPLTKKMEYVTTGRGHRPHLEDEAQVLVEIHRWFLPVGLWHPNEWDYWRVHCVSIPGNIYFHYFLNCSAWLLWQSFRIVLLYCTVFKALLLSTNKYDFVLVDVK